MEALTSSELSALCNENGAAPLVVRDCVLQSDGLADGILNDISMLIGLDRTTPGSIFRYPGMVGFGDKAWKDSQYRGDKSCWLTPDLCKKYELRHIVSFTKTIMKLCSHARRSIDSFGLNGDYSVQLSIFPGGGVARYVRHLDTNTVINQNVMNFDDNNTGLATTMKGERRLTLILYLNKTISGGSLRVYHSRHPESSYIDIEPTFGKLVIFRSDMLEHEVLPSYQDRFAITVWAYATPLSNIPSRIPEALCEPSKAATGRSRGVCTDAQTDESGKVRSSSNASATPSRMRLQMTTRTISPLQIPSENDYNYCIDPAELSERTIFVGIAAYRDSELKHTVRDLFNRAAHPTRVFVGIVWQGDITATLRLRGSSPSTAGNEGKSMEEKGSVGSMGSGMRYNDDDYIDWRREEFGGRVKVLHLDYSQATGPVQARHMVGSLWSGQRYFLQIDSHMRFRPNWDIYLIWLLEDTRHRMVSLHMPENAFFEENTQNEKAALVNTSSVALPCKPILTTYPLGYKLPNDVPEDTRPTFLIASHFDSDGMLRQRGRVIEPYIAQPVSLTSTRDIVSLRSRPPAAVPCPLWAAGFSFSDADVLSEVPYDPLLPHLFFGEEISMAARLYTCGYSFFCPPEAVVYHLWTRDHRPTFGAAAARDRSSVDARDGRNDTNERQQQQKAQSLARVRGLLGIPAHNPALYPPYPPPPAQGVTEEAQQSECNAISYCKGQDGNNLNRHDNTFLWSRYGLGSARPLSQFEKVVGLCFASRTIVSPLPSFPSSTSLPSLPPAADVANAGGPCYCESENQRGFSSNMQSPVVGLCGRQYKFSNLSVEGDGGEVMNILMELLSGQTGSGEIGTGSGEIGTGSGDITAGSGDITAGSGDNTTGSGDITAGSGDITAGSGDITAGCVEEGSNWRTRAPPTVEIAVDDDRRLSALRIVKNNLLIS